MTSVWTGSKVHLRGIEPEDRQAFQRFDEHSADMRNADMIHLPRSAAGYREWAANQATRQAASIALHRKIGFHAEGRLRDHEYFAGRHHDPVVMG